MRKFLLLLLLITATASFAQNTASSLYDQTSEVNNLMVPYRADNSGLSRFYTITNSPERRERLKRMNKEYLAKLEQLNYDKLPVGSKVDYQLFKRNITNELRLLDAEEKEYNQISKWIPFADSIYAFEKQRRRGEALNLMQFAQLLSSVKTQVGGLTKKLSQEPAMTKELSERASNSVKGLQAAIKSINDFYNGYDPGFTWRIPAPLKDADDAMTEYAKALAAKVQASTQKQDGSGIVGNPIGRAELIEQLKNEMIPYTPEELIDIANKEFAWCEAELLKASREMGFGDNWRAAQEKVKNTYVAEGKQPQDIMRIYNESVDFLKKKNLVTIPDMADEAWTMNMLTPDRQRFAPFFLGGAGLLIAYPTNTMSEEDKMMVLRGNNPHFSKAVVHHELNAGHHLQWFSNIRNKTYRNFGTPFWNEGNACYWEFILWDEGFPKGPEDKIGMLFWRMHRCARIIFSLKYHLGEWTPQQCIDFVVERVGHEKFTASSEVRRSFTGGYGPLYQLSYMIGAFQFYALKKELVESGKMTYKQYHDAILREGAMPIELLRAILTNQNLPRNFESSWKFYNR
jgi:uncharacterized protein (DUF885 family)